MADKSGIHLYTAQTPNGIKVSILLEELGLKYEEPWFLEINPNGRIPALTDTFTDGKLIRLFESGSIMQYLVERYDKDHKVSYPQGTREYYEVNSWMGGLGPMQGQLIYFNRYAPAKIPYAIDHYKNETGRLYKTLETQLKPSTSGYLVGDRCTVADFSCWVWVAASYSGGVDLAEFPLLKEWVDRLLARPGVEKGRHVPSPHTALDAANLTEEELNAKAEQSRAWILKGMQADKEKN
ncbi:glutathione S-transferase [Pseudomassariella vexata]|uniref:Glutathione S-transferase n=1 Tax=Pseudomassariella vexata TaxID=1141098 RepID=A0A1Y2EK51_9PEZI|nr:glutathione S-transferase [Pseudomassariella vexata]ORY71921.1 glutathione S-transferase [Pseudomassariella vexata]